MVNFYDHTSVEDFMPIYEYQCEKCGTFEATQRITDKPLAKCPTCKAKVKKLISNTSFQLKGTGWYITDYARKGQNGEAKSDAKTASDGKTETKETKSETKSEAKSESKTSSNSDKSSSASSTPA
jgi:putative FmdB family regulatory protein